MKNESSRRRRFYQYDPDSDHFAAIGFSMDDDDEITDIHFVDCPIAERWKPRICHDFDENPSVEGDFPSVVNFRSVPVMSAGAWQALEPLIGYCCEALPIVHPSGKPFFIIHMMDTIDCLDDNA